jgi:hypothetical protein
MFEFLAELGLEPLAWEKLLAATGEAAPYVGEVLVAGFEVAQAVVVLLTPDDEARLRPMFHQGRDPTHEKELTAQARPNVLFEAGMALMRHPKRTVLVELGELRPFSDVAGRHTVRMNDSIEQRMALISRLQTAGCPVQLDGDWQHAGNFGLALEVDTESLPVSESEGSAGVPRFALVTSQVDYHLGGAPVTLSVENHGPSDEFEAAVVALQGSDDAVTPWYIRWSNSQFQHQEILIEHHWVLELCSDDTDAGEDLGIWTPVWRFFRPKGDDLLIVPDYTGSADRRYAGPIRVTVRVTPRSNPKWAQSNTVTLSLSDRGRTVSWDHFRVD